MIRKITDVFFSKKIHKPLWTLDDSFHKKITAGKSE